MACQDRLAWLAALAGALSASTALAAEAPRGPFLGAQLGWAGRSGPAGYQPSFRGAGQAAEGEASALMAQAFAGYDMPLAESWLTGVEVAGGYGGGDREARRSGSLVGASRTKAHYSATVRVGRVLANGLTPYARAGFAAERVHETYRGPIILIFPPPQTDDTVWKRGAQIGAGVERAVGPHVSLRAEYAYRFLTGGYHVQSLLAGLAWRF